MNLKQLLPKRGITAIKDLFLSIFAYALPVLLLTFFIQPYMARLVSGDEYGRFLTYLSVIRLLCCVFSGSLANLRLLRNSDYERAQTVGDFNPLLLVSSILSSAALVIALYLYGATSIWDYVLSLVTMLLIMVHDYFAVYFRVIIQYKKLVWNNMFIIAGYILGLLLYTKYPMWQFVMISGYVCGLIYVLFNSPFCREPIRKTPLFKDTRKSFLQLSSSQTLRETTIFCDRLLIYPILGGTQVSVYNAAAVSSKVIQLVSSPLSQVILSYVVRWDSMDKKMLKRVFWLTIPFGAITYGGLYLIGCILLPLMYPTFAEEANRFLWIVLLGLLMNSIAALFNTLLMHFDKMKTQIVISSMRLISYLVTAIPLGIVMGLSGFCISLLFSSLLFLGFVLIRLMYVVSKQACNQSATVETPQIDA